MAESESRKITGGELGAAQESLEHACKAAGLSAGDPIVVSWQGDAYIYHCEGTVTGDVETTQYPNCQLSECERYRAQIQEICKNESWPPGQPILVCNANGECCYCYCR